MKYYCNNCKTEYKFQEGGYDPDEMCPVCGNQDPDYDLIPIPDWETPKQREERTGEPVDGNAAVWLRVREAGFDRWEWEITTYELAEERGEEASEYGAIHGYDIVLADPVTPPGDWNLEGAESV